MPSNGSSDLNRLKARATELLSTDAQTTLYKLVSLRQKASEILLGWGPTYREIRLEIEKLDFEPDCPARYKNRPITQDTQPLFGPNRYNQERYSTYLCDVLQRYIRLIEAAHSPKQSEGNVAIPAGSTTPTPDSDSQRQTVMHGPAPRKASSRGRGRKQPLRLSPTDADRYKRIGRQQIETYTNPELWTRCRTVETQQRRRELRPKINYQAFRVSLNRIRRHYKLPSSSELKKKK